MAHAVCLAPVCWSHGPCGSGEVIRRCSRQAKNHQVMDVSAASTLRARRIKKGTLVLASNLSAMFDPLKIEDPESFRIDRPWRSV